MATKRQKMDEYEYASSCVLPTEWIDLPLVGRFPGLGLFALRPLPSIGTNVLLLQ